MEEETIEAPQNDQMALICGESGMGKSASLMKIPDQDYWAYFNCEAGKRLPFKNKFDQYRITDPYEIHEGFEHFNSGGELTNGNECRGAIIDTVTFMMDMFESKHIIGSADTMKGWSNYAQFWKKLMQHYVTTFNRPVLMLGHTLDMLDEKAMEMKTSVPVKGSLKNQGLEAYFSTVVLVKKIELKALKGYENDLLNITEDEKELGYKHVFQTRPTKTSVGTRIRSPLGMFTRAQTYMDNDANLLLEHLRAYYA